jgi:hypothetical protein
MHCSAVLHVLSPDGDQVSWVQLESMAFGVTAGACVVGMQLPSVRYVASY